MSQIQLTENQIELARHALGLPNKRRKSYRNRFVAGPGSKDYEAWLAMVALGAAKRVDASRVHCGGDDLFFLTLSGARAATKRGESLCAEDFPRDEPRHHESTCSGGGMIERKPGAE